MEERVGIRRFPAVVGEVAGVGFVEFDAFGLPVVADLLARFRGPLSGLYSTLQYLADRGQDSGLVLCPCDAPFIPSNLVKVLLESDQDGSKPVVAVSYQGVLQPTFSLWHGHHLPMIKEAVVNRGRGGLKHMFRSLPHIVVEWESAEPPPFHNINTREELESAVTWLD